MLRYTLSLSISTALLLSSATAFGQDTGESDDLVLEEVMVTARKQSETLQEVPFSIAAMTEGQMQDRGIVTIEDVARNTAGFSVQNLGPGQSQVAIRGLSGGQVSRDQAGVKENVGVYFDESVISTSLFTPDLDLYDMNRVEVLRGPQGTLYGAGSTSGTVRYITNQPEIGDSSSTVELDANYIDGGDTGGGGKAAINIPLGDTVAARVVAYYTSFAGYMDAVQPDGSVDQDVNSGDRLGTRISLRFEPNDQLTITPRIVYQEVNMDGWNRIDAYNILANPFTTTRPPVTLGKRELFTQIDEPFSDEFLLADLNIEYDFGDVLLTSITSYMDRDILVVRDSGALTSSVTGGSIGLPEDVYTLDATLDDITTLESLTQELRFSGGTDTIDWVAGFFYSDIKRHYNQFLEVPGFEDLSGIPTAGEFAPKDFLFWSDLDYSKYQQIAVFGELTWAVNDRLDLTGGVRWYDFEEERTQIFDGLFGADGNGNAVQTAGKTSSDGISPRFVASWAATDDVQINAQVAKGFRLGGINDALLVNLCTPADLETFGGFDTWDDEVIWNYEIGAKTTIADGRGILNVSLFYMDISDLQGTLTAGSCSSRIIFNIPEAESIGIEFELAFQVTDRFDFAISASHIESEITKTVSSIDAGGNPVDIGVQKGNPLPTVPENQAAIAGTYAWPIGDNWEGYATGTWQYVDSRFTQLGDQIPGFGTVDLHALGNDIGGPLTEDFFFFDPELPSYSIGNLRFGMRNDKYDVSLYINNVGDERAFLALDQERGTLARVGFLTNQPRTYGVTGRIRF